MTIADKLTAPPKGHLLSLGQFSAYVDLRPEIDFLVKITAQIDPSGKTTWSFTSLDPEFCQVHGCQLE